MSATNTDNMLRSSIVRKDCPICNTSGLVEAVEMVPGQGVLYKSTHDDGRLCHWSIHANIEAMRTAKTDHPRQEIKCPECNELGIIIAEKDESDRMKPDTWNYSISHPKNKCAIRPENRDIILKALDRYIIKDTASNNISSEKDRGEEKKPERKNRRAEIQCPKPGCGKIGKVQFRTGKSPAIIHLNIDRPGRTWHSMDTPQLKEIFIARLRLALKSEPQVEQKAKLGRPQGKKLSIIQKLENQNTQLKQRLLEKDEYIRTLHKRIQSLAECVRARF